MSQPRSQLRSALASLRHLAPLALAGTAATTVAACAVEPAAELTTAARPEVWLSRSDVAAILAQSIGLATPWPAFPVFADVATTDPRLPAIEAFWREGLTSGCSAGDGVRNFCPDEFATRGQAAVFLERAFVIVSQPPPNVFPDVPSWRADYPYIQALAGAGLAVPCPGFAGTFCPDERITWMDLMNMLGRITSAGISRPAPQPIHVISGTYGGNGGAPWGNATVPLRWACEGTAGCAYTISVGVIGDPLPGVAKDYLAEWTCNAGGPVHHAWHPAEAGFGSVVELTCD